MKQQIFRLSELVVDEISIVDKAAIRRTFLVLKRDTSEVTGMDKEDDTPVVNTLTLECSDGVAKLLKAAVDAAEAAKDSEKLSSAVRAIVKDYLAIVSDGWKALSQEFTPKAAPEPAWPAEVQKAIDTVKAENAELTKRLDEEVSRNVIASFVSLAKAEFGALPATPDVVGAILRKSADDEGLMTLLRAANAAFVAMTKSIGKDPDLDDANAPAVVLLEKHAITIAARDGLTKEKAFVKALNEHPELAARERAERQARATG